MMNHLSQAPMGISQSLKRRFRRKRWYLAATFLLLATPLLAVNAVNAQNADRVAQAIDTTKVVVLKSHVPQWANADNLKGTVPEDQALNAMTIVLSRSPQQQLAFEKLLADQRDPASSEYHHWLSPTEVGNRFGPTNHDLDAVITWLQSEGLSVTWVSPSGMFIAFQGMAGSASRAFQTEMHHYNVNGEDRISTSSDPMIPATLAPVIKAIRGLHTIHDRPLHNFRSSQSPLPEYTAGSSSYFMVPADFAKIYDVPSTLSGSGVTVGIVGEARTDFADFANFRRMTGTSFSNPTEVIPTPYGGVDPGPAYTTAQSCNDCVGDQAEATLDVTRVGSIAQNANILLVTASEASGGIDADAEYIVNTEPVLAQIMSISFGECESEDGQADTDFWDALYEQGAGEGISTFVSSGDSGASGCDSSFATPPAHPAANSPNALCSSTYATCLGGTEFNDASDYTEYWSSTNNSHLGSALSYIPEGAWNEPTSGSRLQVAASGGGVSKYIATPSWQTGTGVPSARAGRYTPDIAFSASDHDGYFGCLAAISGGSCASGSGFVVFSGTSAAAPDMAGITALLDQKEGSGQGSINPRLYQLATNNPPMFHDVTVASSGVASCSVNTPSMCNNSIAGRTGLTGGQAGYLVATGYDEVTGLGSLDVAAFIDNFNAPAIMGFSAAPSTVNGDGTITYTVSLTADAPVGGALVSLSSSAPSIVPSSSFTISAGSTSGQTAVTAEAPSVSSQAIITADYNGSSAQATVTVNPATLSTITFSVPSHTYGDTPFNVSAMSNSSGAFTYSVQSGNATISGSTVTLTGIGPVTLLASQAAAGTYGSGSQTATFNVAAGAPTITFSVPNHNYGDAPFTVSATSNSSGAITYSEVSGHATISGSTVTLTGIGMVTLLASQAAAGNYRAGSQTATFSVAGQAQTITFPQPTSPVNYGAAPITLSASASSGLSVTFSVISGPARVTGSTLTITGAGTVAVAANQAGSGSFAAAPAVTRSILVNRDVPTVGFSLTPNPVVAQNNITLTATASSSVSTPTGSVTFYDGSTSLGSVTLSGGTATMSTTSLAVGQHSISAVYNGDSNFEMVTTSTVSETVVDFSLSVGSSSAQTVQPGGTATYTVAFSLTGGGTLPAPVTFAASGQPTGASVSFSPSSLATGSGGTNITVTVQTPSQSAKLERSRHLGDKLPLFAFCMLLPLAGTMRRYKRLRHFLSVALILLGVSGIAMLSGCGGSATFTGQAQTQTESHNIVLTAASGTLSHSATVSLTVE